MKFIQSVKMALKAIWGNKMRSFLTLLGVMIGVIAVVVLVAIAQGSTSSVTARIEAMGTNLISVTINARRNSPVTMKTLSTLESSESIEYVAPLTSVAGATVKSGVSTFDDITVQGTTTGYLSMRNWELLSGRFIKTPDLDNRTYVAVLGYEAATEMFGTTNVVGETFSINGLTFTGIGVLNELDNSLTGSSNTMIVIPYTLAQRMNNSTSITSFYLSAVDSDSVTDAQETVENYLASLSSTTRYSIFNQASQLATLSETTATLTLMLGGIAAISLLVGGIGIMNIMLVSVSERTREIGIRKAIGASRGSILMQFLVESLTISLLGGLLGLLLSIGICIVIEPILQQTSSSIALSVSPTVGGIAVGFSVLIGVVFGLYPANKASKLRPIEALRYEG